MAHSLSAKKRVRQNLKHRARNRARKAAVRSELGLVISVGVATTKLGAQIGSDLRKPDGLVIVPAGEESAFRAPLESPVRALILSGELDFNTPPEQGEELRRGMRNATHLVVENAGHEQTFQQFEAGTRAVVDFLAGKDVKGRRLQYAPLRFVPLERRGGPGRHPAVGD